MQQTTSCDAMEGGSMVLNVDGDDAALIGGLPPGFRFHPTDEEIITHYLTPKVTDRSFTAAAIGEVDLNKCEPWDLHEKAKMGEKEWFFFCQRDRKYPTGMRTNRATDSGYWKATGKDKAIHKKGNSGGGGGGVGKLVGMKKTLVFYKGRAPKGLKTNWVMHEFRLEGDFSYYNMARPPKDEWVVCRIVQKNTEIMRNTSTSNHGMTRTNSFVKELLESPSWLPPLMESPPPRFDPNIPGSSFTHSYLSHDHQPQKDQDYKNFIVSPYNNFDTNSLLMNPFTNDLQSDFPSTLASSSSTNFPYLSSGSTPYYMDRAGMLDGDRAQELAAGQCKVEPYNAYESSKISVSTSQDTGISNDTATYTSSTSIHDIYAYNAL